MLRPINNKRFAVQKQKPSCLADLVSRFDFPLRRPPTSMQSAGATLSLNTTPHSDTLLSVRSTHTTSHTAAGAVLHQTCAAQIERDLCVRTFSFLKTKQFYKSSM